MRRRAAAGALLGVVGLAAIALAFGRPPQASRPAAAAPERAARALPAARTPAPEPALDRNPFDYADAPAPRTSAPERTGLVAPIVMSTPAPEPVVRLTGFVRRGGTLRAALSVRGEVWLLAVGEAASGFTLLAADEEAGVRLRDPLGAELALGIEP